MNYYTVVFCVILSSKEAESNFGRRVVHDSLIHYVGFTSLPVEQICFIILAMQNLPFFFSFFLALSKQFTTGQ